MPPLSLNVVWLLYSSANAVEDRRQCSDNNTRLEADVSHDTEGSFEHINEGKSEHVEPVLVTLDLSHSYLSSQASKKKRTQVPMLGSLARAG